MLARVWKHRLVTMKIHRLEWEEKIFAQTTVNVDMEQWMRREGKRTGGSAFRNLEAVETDGRRWNKLMPTIVNS